MSEALVELRNITHLFGATEVLTHVSLTIGSGSYTVLLGPSGSGKTTLLSIIGGFLFPSEGSVMIRGQDCTTLPPAQRPTVTVFQDYALFPHMSVGSNVGFGLRMRRVAREGRERRAREALDVVGLPEAFHKRPHQLSGGQRQRVALARALVVEPAVLLLDEPLGALDLKLRRQMQDELKAIQQRVGTAFIHVTHDQEEAMALADHCVVMNHGRIEDEGPPERIYALPSTRFSAAFMGESTLIPDRNAWLAIRPEHLRLTHKPGTIALGEAQVTGVVFQGSFKRVLAESVTGQKFIAKVTAETSVATGDNITPSCRAEDMVRLER